MWKGWRPISDSPYSLFHDVLKPLVVIAIVLILFLVVSQGLVDLFSSIRLMDTRGNLYTDSYIEIYQDSNCTNLLSWIDWGSVEPGMTRNTTVYIRNEAKQNVNLAVDTTNWQPENISRYMNLTWDYNGVAVFPGEIIQVTFALSSSSSLDFTNYLIAHDVSEFSFDIIINAFI